MCDEQIKNKITLCMGSACFTRGNNRNLEIIKNYLKDNNLESEVLFKGCLCNNLCNSAPVITINEKTFEQVSPQAVSELLDHFIKNAEKNDE